jgi:phage terminase large subunit-like protein
VPAKFDRAVQSWDTAAKATELTLPFPPPHAGRMRGREGWGRTSWGIQGKKLYVLDVLRRRMEYPALKCAVRDQYTLWPSFNASAIASARVASRKG